MDPGYSLQDVIRCHQCETPVPSMYCNICDEYLCKFCEEGHLADISKQHNVISVEKRRLTPKCPTHLKKITEHYCEDCDFLICASCLLSEKHNGHKFIEISKNLENKKEVIQKDLQELELIFPKYQEIVSNIPIQKAELKEKSWKVKTAIDKRGEDLHREIDTLIENLKLDYEIIDFEHLAALNEQEDEITGTISEITHCIADLKTILSSDDVSLVFAYKSRIPKFRILPFKLTDSLPSFIPQKINKEQLYQQFGSLSPLSNKTEEHDYTFDLPGAESSHPDRPLVDTPRIITKFMTEFEAHKYLKHHHIYGVSCLSDEEIWTSGSDNIIRLYSLRGELMKSIQIESRDNPLDIAVTRIGDLVYTDYKDRTVNIVKNTETQTVIKLQEWKPRSLCSTISGDFLVVMDSVNKSPSKVVRYSNFTDKETIQYDDKGYPLYSYGGYDNTKYISENKNLDICVSDRGAGAVVVVNQAGKHKFNYKGQTSFVSTSRKFYPYGIATDSQGRILTADYWNHRIHILNQNGKLLRYIYNGLWRPCCLCVDTKDNLFVFQSGELMKIQYSQRT